MKKKLLALAIAVVMIISMLPLTAFAASPMPKLQMNFGGGSTQSGILPNSVYYITFAANETYGMLPSIVEKAPEEDSYIKLYFDGTNDVLNILVRNVNYVYTGSSGVFLHFYENNGYSSDYSVVVTLEGENVFDGPKAGMQFEQNGDVTITGDDSLTINTTESSSKAINKTGTGKLHILNTTLDVNLKDTSSGSVFGIYVTNDIMIEGSDVEVRAGKKSTAIRSYQGVITVKNSDLFAEKTSGNGAVVQTAKPVVFDNSNVILKNTTGNTGHSLSMAPDIKGTYSAQWFSYKNTGAESTLYDYAAKGYVAGDAWEKGTTAGTSYNYFWLIHEHVRPETDDGDCTTPIACACTKYVYEAGAEAHSFTDKPSDQLVEGTANSYYVQCDNCDVVSDTVTIIFNTEECTHEYAPEQTYCDVAVECPTCGNIAHEAKSHTPGTAADCENDQICTVCEKVLVEKLGHTPGAEATCTTAQICTVCEDVIVAAKGHPLTAHRVSGTTYSKVPTCTEPGVKQYKHCPVCDRYFNWSTSSTASENANYTGYSSLTSFAVDPLGHTEGDPVVEPETGDTVVSCTVCGAEISRVPAPEPECTHENAPVQEFCDVAVNCPECGEEVHAAKDHTEGKAADCENDQICTVCQKVLAEKLGHNYDKGYCSNCKEKDPDATFVAIVGEKEYVSLQDAIDEAEGKTVTLLGDVDMNRIRVTITTNCTLDLAGYTLTSYNNHDNINSMAVYVQAGKSFTLIDTVGTGKIISSCYGVYVKEGATFTMNGGTLTVSGNGTYDYAVVLWDGAFTMNGGAINAYVGAFANSGSAVINGGTFMVTGDDPDVLYAAGEATFVINGGSFNEMETVLPYVASGATITLSADAVVEYDAELKAGATYVIPQGMTLTIAEGVTVTADAAATLNCYGKIVVAGSADISELIYGTTFGACGGKLTVKATGEVAMLKSWEGIWTPVNDPALGAMLADCEVGAKISVGAQNWQLTESGWGHTHIAGAEVQEKVVEATCTVAGSYESVVYCTVCNDELSRKTVTGETLPHDYAENVTAAPTCNKAGKAVYTCIGCGDSYEEVIPAKGHILEVVAVIAPTCNRGGYTQNKCTGCGGTFYTEETGAKGHNLQVVSVVAPTCNRGGYTQNKCTGCGGTFYTEEVGAKGHNLEVTSVVTATCNRGGYTTKTCTGCGGIFKTDEVAANGHSFTEKVKGINYRKSAATATSGALFYYACAECGESSEGHTNATWEYVSTAYSASSIVRIEDRYYNSFAAAIEAAGEGETIVLLKDVKEGQVIEINKNVKIDFNNHVYTVSNDDNTGAAIIVANGVETTLSNGTVQIRYTARTAFDCLVVNNGTVNASNITLKATNVGGENAVAVKGNAIEGATIIDPVK